MPDAPELHRTFPYLGRTEDYTDFQLIDTGRRIERIESWTRGAYGIVRITTQDGQEGYGQLSPFEPDLSATVLHRQVARHLLGSDPSRIDALMDRCIDANMKFPWSYLCRALAGVDTALEAGKQVVPHSANHSMVTLFALHFMAAIPNAGPFVEFSIEEMESPPQDALYHPTLQVRDGKVSSPEGAGWGGEIEPSWLNQAEYRKSEA